MPGIPWSRETDNVIVLKDCKQEILGRINKKRYRLASGQNVDILWKEMLTVYRIQTRVWQAHRHVHTEIETDRNGDSSGQ